MKLTPERVEQFRRDGYLNIESPLIDAEYLGVLRERYDAVFAERHGGGGEGVRNLAVVDDSAETDGAEEMLQIMEMWQLDPEFRKLLYHGPLLDVAESLIGGDIQLFHDQALYKPAYHGGEVFWHQDNGYWRCEPPDLVSIWIALDDADTENGCMNVIPGSHLEGLVSHGRAETERGEVPALLQVAADAGRAVPVPVAAGHAMVHHCLTLHQTEPNRSPRDRRAMVIHYMPAGTRNSQGEVMREKPLLRGSLP